MSFGAIALAFGVVVFVLTLLAKLNSHPGLAEMTTLGVMAVIVGAGLLALGFFLSRMGNRGGARPAEDIR
jgi:hypothetical protein